MILSHFREFIDLVLDAYADELLKRPLRKTERDIFFLYNEFYINKEIQNAKDNISELVQKYIKKVKENENSSN